MRPLPIQPIPDRCPIKRHDVAKIGGIIQENPIYVLCKGRKEVVIQAYSKERPLPDQDPNNADSNSNLISEMERTYNYYLGEIATLLTHMDVFTGESNWGYLMKGKKTGQFFITLKPKPLPVITCPLWASDIREEEIEFRVWGMASDRRGIWRDKPVDVIYAWNDDEMDALNRAMYGWRAVDGLDVTFEVYGHLIGADGKVIGLVSEAAMGRMIEPKDAALVYGAISRVQNARCIYQGCLTNRFMISGGKVRLVELSAITPYRTQAMVEEKAERWHWKGLRRLFDEFEEFGPYAKARLPLPRFTATARNITILPVSPRRPDWPSRAMALSPYLTATISIQSREEHEPYGEFPDGDQPFNTRGLTLRRLAPTSITPTFIVDREEGGRVVRVTRLSRHRETNCLNLAHHPYRRRSMQSGKAGALSTTEDTESIKVRACN